MTNDIRSAILTDLSKRNSQPEVVELLQVASFLDPRFKAKYLADEDTENVKTMLCSDGVVIYESLPQPSSTGNGSEQLPAKRKRKCFKLNEGNDSNTVNTQPISPDQKIQLEIAKYIAENELDSEEDPLKWWREHEEKYPILSQVSKKYLAIPATSSPSERLFSRAGNSYTYEKFLESGMLAFLSSNPEPPL